MSRFGRRGRRRKNNSTQAPPVQAGPKVLDSYLHNLVVGDGTARAYGVASAQEAVVWDMQVATGRGYTVGGLVDRGPNTDTYTNFKAYLKDDGTTPTEAVDDTDVILSTKVGNTEKILWQGKYSACKKSGSGVSIKNSKELQASDYIYIRATPTSLSSAATKLDEAETEVYLDDVIEKIVQAI